MSGTENDIYEKSSNTWERFVKSWLKGQQHWRVTAACSAGSGGTGAQRSSTSSPSSADARPHRIPTRTPLTWAFCEHLPTARGRAGTMGQTSELSRKAPLQFCLRQKIPFFTKK